MICLTALRHRLQAEGCSQTLRICRAPGRCLSAIRADRSTLRRLHSSSEDDRWHFIVIVSGSDRIESCLSMRSVWPPYLLMSYCPHRHVTKRKPRIASAVGISIHPVLSDGAHSRICFGLPARRPPPPLTSPRGILMFCYSLPYRAQEHVTALPASSATLRSRATPM